MPPGPRDLVTMRAEVDRRAERLLATRRRRRAGVTAAGVTAVVVTAVSVGGLLPDRTRLVSTTPDAPTMATPTPTVSLHDLTAGSVVVPGTTTVPPPIVLREGRLGPNGAEAYGLPVSVVDAPGVPVWASAAQEENGSVVTCIGVEDANGAPGACETADADAAVLVAVRSADSTVYAGAVGPDVLAVVVQFGGVQLSPLPTTDPVVELGSRSFFAIRLPSALRGRVLFVGRTGIVARSIGPEGTGRATPAEVDVRLAATAVEHRGNTFVAARSITTTTGSVHGEGDTEKASLGGTVVYGRTTPDPGDVDVDTLEGFPIGPGPGLYHFFPAGEDGGRLAIERRIAGRSAAATVDAGAAFDLGDGAFLTGDRLGGSTYRFGWTSVDPASPVVDPGGATVTLDDGTRRCDAVLEAVPSPDGQPHFVARCDVVLDGAVVTLSGTAEGVPLRGIVLS